MKRPSSDQCDAHERVNPQRWGVGYRVFCCVVFGLAGIERVLAQTGGQPPRRFRLRYSRAFTREPQTDIEHQLLFWLRLWS